MSAFETMTFAPAVELLPATRRYAALGDSYAPQVPTTPLPEARLLHFNTALAQRIGLDAGAGQADDLADQGNRPAGGRDVEPALQAALPAIHGLLETNWITMKRSRAFINRRTFDPSLRPRLHGRGQRLAAMGRRQQPQHGFEREGSAGIVHAW